MQRGPAGIRSAGRGAVEVVLNGFGKRIERGTLWTRSARRRQQTCTNFARDLLPGFGLRSDMLEIEFIEHQVAGLQLLVMTGDAILIDERAMLRGGCADNGRRLLPFGLAQTDSGKYQKDRDRDDGSLHLIGGASPISLFSSAIAFGFGSGGLMARKIPCA